MTYSDILKTLPHRYPFLLVDRVITIEEKNITGIKNVSFNEPQFIGHFPDNPVFPGVLVVEALAQLSGIYIDKNYIQDESQIGLFAGIESFSFKGIIRPGDQIVLNAELFKKKMTVFLFIVSAYVNDKVVANGRIKLILSKKGR
ncbi:MAG: 3-hydroxyacyl-ACP dehydratase FabZ [Caldisericia bacterium]|nr:3-hydroxyacyl-ACP dehydratase FabZ [Caldisericia bacterium]